VGRRDTFQPNCEVKAWVSWARRDEAQGSRESLFFIFCFLFSNFSFQIEIKIEVSTSNMCNQKVLKNEYKIYFIE
jgi:hypothetical protein